jgi:hypothetical protein
VYGAITTHELCPPNPKELEIAAANPIRIKTRRKMRFWEIFGEF